MGEGTTARSMTRNTARSAEPHIADDAPSAASSASCIFFAPLISNRSDLI